MIDSCVGLEDKSLPFIITIPEVFLMAPEETLLENNNIKRTNINY